MVLMSRQPVFRVFVDKMQISSKHLLTTFVSILPECVFNVCSTITYTEKEFVFNSCVSCSFSQSGENVCGCQKCQQSSMNRENV